MNNRSYFGWEDGPGDLLKLPVMVFCDYLYLRYQKDWYLSHLTLDKNTWNRRERKPRRNSDMLITLFKYFVLSLLPSRPFCSATLDALSPYTELSYFLLFSYSCKFDCSVLQWKTRSLAKEPLLLFTEYHIWLAPPLRSQRITDRLCMNAVCNLLHASLSSDFSLYSTLYPISRWEIGLVFLSAKQK